MKYYFIVDIFLIGILSIIFGSLEKDTSFGIKFSLDNANATFNVTALDKNSKISSMVYDCGNGNSSDIKNVSAKEVSFECLYSDKKTYDVKIRITTIFGMNFSYELPVTVSKISYSNKLALSLFFIILLCFI